MDHVLPPVSLVDVVRPARVDSCQRDPQVREQLSVIVRHRVITTYEHPPRGIAEALDKPPKERSILQAVHFKLGGRNGRTAARLQFRRDALVDVGIDDEQMPLRQ